MKLRCRAGTLAVLQLGGMFIFDLLHSHSAVLLGGYNEIRLF